MTSSSSSESSWFSWASQKQDEQRLERLQYCQQLEAVLNECQQSAAVSHTKKLASQTTYNPTKMEEFPAGLRMMKYFGWRHILSKLEASENQIENDSTNHKTDKKLDLRIPIIRSCAREHHSVWACRSVAVGCGKELAAVKKCFDQEGPLMVLTQPQTAYEQSSTETTKDVSTIPCAGLQTNLGSCVHKGAKELLERKQQRNQNK